jgi:hypothetical protein
MRTIDPTAAQYDGIGVPDVELPMRPLTEED